MSLRPTSSRLVATALAEKPDVLFVGGPSQPTALVVKAAREQGFKGGFAVMDQAKFEEMYKIVSMEMLENSIGVMPTIHHPDFRAQQFVKKYHAKKGAERIPPREVSLTYGAVRILARAMELAGTTTDARAIHAKADEAAAMLKEAYELPRAPKLDDVFARAFLPPKSERMMPVLPN